MSELLSISLSLRKKVFESQFTVLFIVLCIALSVAFPLNVSASGISIANTCSPVAETTCGLPFPSDLFLNTRGKLNYSDNIFDRQVGQGLRDDLFSVKSQFPEGFRPSQVFNASEGFSALGPGAIREQMRSDLTPVVSSS